MHSTRLFTAVALGATMAAGLTHADAAPSQERPMSTSATVTIYTTAQDTGQRLSQAGTVTLKGGHALTEVENSVFVDPTRRFQSLLGIGGAITDSTAEVYATLAPEKRAEFMRAYYDREAGIGYSLARTTIHSSDFSSASYTYVKEGDKALTSFSIDHDRRARLPMIKQAIAAAGGELPLFASPWSAPAFMKTTGNMLRGGALLPEYRQAWANYFVRFIQAYEKEGVPIWGITVQNEPMATQTWESMLYTAEEERDFLKDYLGPTMHAAGYADKKIIVWDHNRDMMPYRAQVILGDPEAAKYAWGLGFHWYETWAGFDPMFRNVAAVTEAFPDKPVLLTEAAVEKFDPARYQHWPNAERYGTSMIHDLNNGAVGWTDWNMLLDEKGGPNHVGNYCFAPLHADTRTGELIYTPSYYYIGHFSKFIRPQARRVSTATSRSTLLATSFVNPDGRLATVVMNPTDKAIAYNFYVGQASAVVTIPARAIQTLVN
ncbi:glycoside hydrolase family 30 protein [Pseudoxanthomonas mexicana]